MKKPKGIGIGSVIEGTNFEPYIMFSIVYDDGSTEVITYWDKRETLRRICEIIQCLEIATTDSLMAQYLAEKQGIPIGDLLTKEMEAFRKWRDATNVGKLQ